MCVRSAALAFLALLSAGCGTDAVAPNIPREEVAGTYRMSTLAFDPQGTLPEVDLLARLRARGKAEPSLTLLADGKLQLLFEDPGPDLLRLIDGSFRTTPTGVVLDLGSNKAYEALLLPGELTLERQPDGSLSFSGPSGDAVKQTRLLELVPEWSEEPLTNPVPGTLRVAFSPVS